MDSSLFSSYDCVGFDLDNTLAEYKERELIGLIYHILANFMVSEYSSDYDPHYLLKPFEDDIDFIRKGLTVDIERGNIVSLADDGSILRACHGTRPLSTAEIIQTYGPKKMWNVAVKHCEDFLATWNGHLAEKIRSSLDYFDICVPLLFARSIDSVVNTELTAADVWTHVFNSLYTMFNNEEGDDGYYGSLRRNPNKYARKRTPEFLDWLGSFKAANKITYLITGSDYKYAELIASTALGTDWKKYFDIIVYFARKPGFFTQSRDFKLVSPEGVIVPPEELEFGQSYREGNWSGLYKLFAKRLDKDEPKCLYFGDNFIQDIYAPAKFKCCDTIAVIKELANFDRNTDKELFLSNIWGSVLHDKLIDKPTIWNRVLNSYSKLNVPSLDWFLHDNITQ